MSPSLPSRPGAPRRTLNLQLSTTYHPYHIYHLAHILSRRSRSAFGFAHPTPHRFATTNARRETNAGRTTNVPGPAPFGRNHDAVVAPASP